MLWLNLSSELFLLAVKRYRIKCDIFRNKVSHLMTKQAKWLCTQQRLRSAWASAQSDQSLHWVAKNPSFLHVDSEDWANAQADLILRWAYMPFCSFCHEVAQVCHYVHPAEFGDRHSLCCCFLFFCIHFVKVQDAFKTSLAIALGQILPFVFFDRGIVISLSVMSDWNVHVQLTSK